MGVERVIQTRLNTSPASAATSSDPTRAAQEDFRRLDSKVEVSLGDFLGEATEFREWMSKAHSDQANQANQAYRDKEALHERFSEI